MAKKKKTSADIKKELKSNNTQTAIFISPFGGGLIWIIYGFYYSFTWASLILGTLITFVALNAFMKNSGKGGVKCPKCKKDYAMTEDGEEVIEEYQRVERRTINRGTPKSYKANVPVDVQVIRTYMKCIKCGHETQEDSESRTDA